MKYKIDMIDICALTLFIAFVVLAFLGVHHLLYCLGYIGPGYTVMAMRQDKIGVVLNSAEGYVLIRWFGEDETEVIPYGSFEVVGALIRQKEERND